MSGQVGREAAQALSSTSVLRASGVLPYLRTKRARAAKSGALSSQTLVWSENVKEEEFSEKCFFTAVSCDFMNFLEKQSNTTTITTILAKKWRKWAGTGLGPV